MEPLATQARPILGNPRYWTTLKYLLNSFALSSNSCVPYDAERHCIPNGKSHVMFVSGLVSGVSTPRTRIRKISFHPPVHSEYVNFLLFWELLNRMKDCRSYRCFIDHGLTALCSYYDEALYSAIERILPQDRGSRGSDCVE